MATGTDFLLVFLGLLGGLAVAVVVVRMMRTQAPVADDPTRVAAVEARLDEARKALETQRQLLDEEREKSNERFSKVMEASLVKPLKENLEKMEKAVKEIEEKRAKAYGSLENNLRQLGEQQVALQRETSNLNGALRNTRARGKWGEVSLQRVLEVSGMTEHVDFEQQTSTTNGGSVQRPDAIVKLPSRREVVIDSKVPLDAYLDAMSAAEDEEKKKALARHATAVRAHVKHLSAKAYWEQFQNAPDFVVLFLPGEPLLGAAAESDPGLLEDAASAHVIIATPLTLIALLRAVEFGWKQQKAAEGVQKVAEAGREVHDRMVTWSSHMVTLGKSLDKSVDVFNKAVGSLDTNVMPAARRLRELGAAGNEEIKTVEVVETRSRVVKTAPTDSHGES